MSPSSNSSSSLGLPCLVKDSVCRELQSFECVQEHEKSSIIKSNHARVPSVVAKLMGLETLTDSASWSEINMGSCSWFEKTGSCKQIPLSGSIKPMPLFPTEPTSWKKTDKVRRNQEMDSHRCSAKIPYSEIEKRLEDLEFLLCGVDLNAMKQTTESMKFSNLRCHGDSKQQLESCVRSSVHNQKSCTDQVLTSKIGNSASSMNYGKFDIDEMFRTPAPPNSMKSKTHSSKKQSRPKSLVGGRLKDLDFQRGDDRSSEFNVASRNSIYSEIDDTTSGSKISNSDIARQASDNSLVWTSSEFGATFEIKKKRLKYIDSLVQKLERLNSGPYETCIDQIASLCDNNDLDHRYVSEILLASGLLRDFSLSSADFQFHSSGYPLNPELFLVLELKNSSSSSDRECPNKKTSQSVVNEKLHRRLMFDTLNEILARRLSFDDSPSSGAAKLTRTSLNAKQLLKEMCSEIEGLRSKNSPCSSNEKDEQWKTTLFNDVGSESDYGIAGTVLDIERLIFKDLVKEIILGEIVGFSNKTK